MENADAIYIIAEAGINHNGNLQTAKALIDAAFEAGANAVKFQTFKTNQMTSLNAPLAPYQKQGTSSHESQLEMLLKVELSPKDHEVLIRHCQNHPIQFLSTPFDLESVDLLARLLDLPLLKISSGDLTNAPLLLNVAQTGKPVILSTGMSNLEDIGTALGVLAFGYIGEGRPSPSAFKCAYETDAGQAMLKQKVSLLHCTTEYPAPLTAVNLRAMDTLKQTFGLRIGLSDHTVGITVPIAAAARGASIIEKHFTLSRDMPGPDHQASLEPNELKLMVQSIREVEKALGFPEKIVTSSEMNNRSIARKSLVAACDIQAGEIFTEKNLGFKRPGQGLSPILYWEWLGKKARKIYHKDDLID